VREAWREPSLEHIAALSDDVGIAQHATFDIPNRHEGYCTDDVARAFIVTSVACGFDRRREEALRLGRVYLSFLLHAQRPDGQFRNFMSYERTWLDEVGSPDSNGRAIWSLGHGMRYAPREAWRKVCREMLERSVSHALDTPFVRARSYAALGLAHAFEALGRDARAIEAALREIGEDLVARHAACAAPDWDWFEDEMTYDNARLPEALLRIGAVLGDARFADLGLRTFAFYESVVVENETFVPIGSDGWYPRGGRRARFAQQPLRSSTRRSLPRPSPGSLAIAASRISASIGSRVGTRVGRSWPLRTAATTGSNRLPSTTIWARNHHSPTLRAPSRSRDRPHRTCSASFADAPETRVGPPFAAPRRQMARWRITASDDCPIRRS
jgi:hypothetical protein